MALNMTFEETLDKHLTAFKSRDLNSFKETLLSDGRLSIILLDGTLMTDFESIVAFHKEWFEDEDWKIYLREVQRLETENMCNVLFEVDYDDLDPDGIEYHLHYYLNLTFIRDSTTETWLLAFDQNTYISENEA